MECILQLVKPILENPEPKQQPDRDHHQYEAGAQHTHSPATHLRLVFSPTALARIFGILNGGWIYKVTGTCRDEMQMQMQGRGVENDESGFGFLDLRNKRVGDFDRWRNS